MKKKEKKRLQAALMVAWRSSKKTSTPKEAGDKQLRVDAQNAASLLHQNEDNRVLMLDQNEASMGTNISANGTANVRTAGGNTRFTADPNFGPS